MQEIWQQFLDGMRQTGWLEYLAVFAGIASVWFSKKEQVLVYPVGLVNTVIYVYLSAKVQLFGEATVNFYFTVMSIYGWLMWRKKDSQRQLLLHISESTMRERLGHAGFFLSVYLVYYAGLGFLKRNFSPDAIPWADAFATAAAFTGMWLMTRKKVESWYWWIATNIASIPLYFVKGFVFTSVYYAILLILAFQGLQAWKRKASPAVKYTA